MNLIEKARKSKRKLNNLLLGSIILVELIILSVVLYLFFSNETQNIYHTISISLVVIWLGIVLGYFAWVIYFYNINLGLTNEDWATIREAKELNPDADIYEPTKNPHATESMGLPPGTIRGTLSLTVTVGGLSILIASLGIEETDLAENSFFVDHIDFFKTAFLMVIAFYFGNKSIEAIGKLSPIKGTGSSGSGSSGNSGGGTAAGNGGGSDAPAMADVNPQAGKEAGTVSALKDALMTNFSDSENPMLDEGAGDFDNPNALG